MKLGRLSIGFKWNNHAGQVCWGDYVVSPTEKQPDSAAPPQSLPIEKLGFYRQSYICIRTTHFFARRLRHREIFGMPYDEVRSTIDRQRVLPY